MNEHDATLPLVELTRGDVVESSHRGALAVVDAQGRLLAAVGDPQHMAYLRSSAKPFQALPTVDAGALDDTLVRAGGGSIVSKGGAEGYQGLGIRTPDGRSVGLALKIEDGNARAKGPVIVAVLEALGLVGQHVLARLEPLRRPPIVNHRQQVVGEMRAVLDVDALRATAAISIAA